MRVIRVKAQPSRRCEGALRHLPPRGSLRPNRRSSVMRSSPVIVAAALCVCRISLAESAAGRATCRGMNFFSQKGNFQ